MLGSLIQFVDALANQFVIATGDRILQRGDAGFNFSALFGGQAGGLRIGERFGSGRQDRFGFGARFDDLAFGEILLSVFNGFLEHTLDFGIIDAVAGLDFNGMLLAGAKILGTGLQNTVGVDEKFHFDAREAGGGGRNRSSEAGQRAAIFG